MGFSRSTRLAGWGLVLFALLILWMGNATDIDIKLADAMFDPVRHRFPMQHAWIAERFNHVILKGALSAMAAAAVVLALWDAARPRAGWRRSARVGMRVVAMSAVLVPLVISVLKLVSTSHCPWDLARYGGTEPYVRLLEWMPAGVKPGHCMPGGHASSALWLVSLAAFWWPHSRAKAIAVGLSMLVFGLIVGWAQQMRGAHFLTHTLWSAWIACAMVFAIYSMNTRGLARRFWAGYNSVPAATHE
jgi:membrane-associated PAP2 superfamily phosphatase